MSTTASSFPVTKEPISSDVRPASPPILDAAFAGVRRVPEPVNDPNRSYAPGTPERAELKARLKTMAAERIEIPLIIGGNPHRQDRAGGDAARPQPRAGGLSPCQSGARSAGDRGLRDRTP